VNHDFAVGKGERYFPIKITRFVMNIAPVYKYAVVGWFSRTRPAFRGILQHFFNEKALLSLKIQVQDLHLSKNPYREVTEFWVENYLTWDSTTRNWHAEVGCTFGDQLPLISIDNLLIFHCSYPLRSQRFLLGVSRPLYLSDHSTIFWEIYFTEGDGIFMTLL